ncbi:MAG: cell division protein FtsA [Calditrichaeota bacterium]|nr:MAG: cell division protein FtsA [Calditrichota bacterium]MBL1206560.1 cell division protein FtsA [Calditrichota bacterium]NOG46387.1 cell division protein FtsA [Calditrichota bacterium]
MKNEDIIVGLDIGTTKIAAVVGRRDEYGQLNIVGVGQAPSDGLRRGVVINIRKTIQSIKKAIEDAELMAGHKITGVYAGIAGDHIRSINSKGVIAVSSKDKIITEEDVVRVIDAAKAIALPMDREILHVLPQEYVVDEQDGIKNPVGMAGTRLEAEVHIVTGAAASAQNIVNCIHEAGYEVADIVLEPYASSLAVLDTDERELGVAIVDIGGGTTDIAMIFDGSVRYTSVIGLGGQHLTSDISQGLRTSADQAEDIKKKHGVAMQSLIEADELIKVAGVGGRKDREVSKVLLSGIIQPRMEEMLQLAIKEMEKSNILEFLGAGIVLTGGAALLDGIVDLAERVTGIPVKIGKPIVSGGLVESVDSPMYSTGVGLIQYALKYEGENEDGDKLGFNWIMDRLRSFFDDLFK